jgi:hypothetical protein
VRARGEPKLAGGPRDRSGGLANGFEAFLANLDHVLLVIALDLDDGGREPRTFLPSTYTSAPRGSEVTSMKAGRKYAKATGKGIT